MDRNPGFYEMNKPAEGAQISTKIKSESIPCGSTPFSESVPLDTGSQDPQQRKSKCVSSPCHRFDICGEVFMCTPQDEEIKSMK